MNDKEIQFYIIGISHKTANIKLRSKFSLSYKDQENILINGQKLGINNLMVLSTCNRTELIGFAKKSEDLIWLLSNQTSGTISEFKSFAYTYKNHEAVNHFIKTTTGLNSQILGDYEIVSQIKNAFKIAKKNGNINTYLEKLYNLSLQANKEVKNSTELSSKFTSVSHETINYIIEKVSGLEQKHILVIGLGSLGLKSLRLVLDKLKPAKVSVLNRTDSKTFNLAKRFNITPICFKDLITVSKHSDIIIVATNAHKSILNFKHINNSKEQWIFDLSVPANVDSNIKKLPNKHIIDVDSLTHKVKISEKNKNEQIPLAIKIIEKYKDEFINWVNFRKSSSQLKTIKSTLDKIQEKTIALHLKTDQTLEKNQIEEITSILITKIMAKFAVNLKKKQNYDDEVSLLLEDLFI